MQRSKFQHVGAKLQSVRAMAIAICVGVSLCPVASLRAGSIFDDDWKEPAPAPKTSPPIELPPAPSVRPDQPKSAAPAPTPEPAPIAPPQNPGGRKAVPARDAQVKTRKLFKEVFATQLADHTPAGRRALASRLMEEAGKAQGLPVDNFVLLTGAIAAGRDAGALDLCTQAADTLASNYEVDGLRLKVDAALKMSMKASTPVVAAENARDALLLIDSLIAANDYATALRVIGAVRPAAASDPVNARRFTARASAIEVLKSESDACVADLQKLKAAPHDPAANFAVGRFLCFVQGRWQSGLPFLANGSDAELKSLAQREPANPTDAGAVMKLADEWWTIQKRQTGLVQANIGRHVADLYQLVADGFTGLQRLEIDQRIATIADQLALVKGVPTYLTSLKEVDVRCLDSSWNASLWKGPIKVNGVEGWHGMYLHPGSDDSSHVTYELDGRGILLETRLGLSDDVGSCWTPLTFKVIGDDKVLWTSKKVRERLDAQSCRVSILGVHRLTLMVDCPGRYEYAHATWLDPQVMLDMGKR